MSSFLERIRDSHNQILVFLLFAVCLATLLYLYPREGQFKYEYAEGQIWQYEDYFAPKAVEVTKLEDEVAESLKAIRENEIPVYKRKRIEALTSWATTDSTAQDSLLDRLLREVLDVGVIQLIPRHEELGAEDKISVRQGAVASVLERQDLLTMSEAAAEMRRRWEEEELGPFPSSALEKLQYNLVYDSAFTAQMLQREIDALDQSSGALSSGELVIRKGEQIGRQEFRELKAIERQYEQRAGSGTGWWIILLGQTLLIGLGLFSFVIIIRLLKPDILETPTRVTFLLILVVLMALTVKIALEVPMLSIYLAPLCIFPIVLRAFYDARLALLLHIVNVFMLSFIVPSAFEFVFLQIFAGILLLYGMRSLARRAQFFNAAVVIFISYSATYLGLNIIQEGSFEGIHLTNYAWFGGNAVLSMLAFPLIYFFERSFGLLSDVRLLEISDSSNVLLRELNEKAPGTFQHTLQVANLAEEGVRSIGGSVLLVRAGALYHDIGKMEAPQYFTENQHGVNPHDDLSNEESARIIIHHVIKGIELARKHRLPEEVIDFIRTHHGTTRPEYFYRLEVKEMGVENVDETKFRYPGPKPFSKETAVLMMADAVEAASRSLPEYSEERLEELIENIVRHQQEMGQFENAAITFKEINEVKKVFLRKLKNIYHSRIAYPKG